MFVQITDLGVAALTAGGGAPLFLTRTDFGSGVAYTPQPTDTALHGSTLFSVAPSSPVAVNANVVRYSAFLDYSVGPFGFGEFGLFMSNGNLFALGSNDTLIQKIAQTSGIVGNSVRLDIYLSMVGDNYDMWLDLANSNSDFRLATVNSVDQLFPSSNAVPNAYIVQAAEDTQTSFFAYTDRIGLWNFDAYAFSTTGGSAFTITGATNTSIDIAIADFNASQEPDFLGDTIIQFTSSALYSICRNVVNIVTTPSTATLNFQTPFAIVPPTGSTFYLYKRDPFTTSNVVVPPATTTSLGVVEIGAGLAVAGPSDPNQGRISVDRTTVTGGLAYSVNGHQGDVELNATDLPGIVLSVNSATPDVNGNVTLTFPAGPQIATSSIAGIVKSSATITVAVDGTMGLGFTPVTSVNSVSGAVTIDGLINPTTLISGTDLNTIINAGLYSTLTDAISASLLNAPAPTGGALRASIEVIPLTTANSGDSMQRWMQHGYLAERTFISNVWSAWSQVGAFSYTLPIASDTTVGGVTVALTGAGLALTGAGALSTLLKTVNTLSPDVGGNITITAASIGAIGATSIGTPGGPAGPLSIVPSIGDPNVNAYTYSRIVENQLPLGAFDYWTTWDASANVATRADTITAAVHTYTLTTGGTMVDAFSTTAIPPVAVSVTVPAYGKVFYVSTAGTTALDGITNWNAGDLAIALDTRWVRVASGGKITEVDSVATGTGGSVSQIANTGATTGIAQVKGIAAVASSGLSLVSSATDNTMYINRSVNLLTTPTSIATPSLTLENLYNMYTSGTAATVTVPLNMTSGTTRAVEMEFVQTTFTGVITISPASGVTFLNSGGGTGSVITDGILSKIILKSVALNSYHVQLISSSVPRPPAYCMVSLSPAYTFTAANVLTQIPLSNVIVDNRSWWDATNHKYTPGMSGWYRVTWQVLFSSTFVGTALLQTSIENGSNITNQTDTVTYTSGTAVDRSIISTALVQLTTGTSVLGAASVSNVGVGLGGGTASAATYLIIEYVGP